MFPVPAVVFLTVDMLRTAVSRIYLVTVPVEVLSWIVLEAAVPQSFAHVFLEAGVPQSFAHVFLEGGRMDLAIKHRPPH